MTAEGTRPAEQERYLSLAAVAGRFLTRLENVQRWIDEGRLRVVQTPRGPRIPESSLLEFERQAYRRENYTGLDHGLHSWPNEQPEPSSLPVPVQNAQEGLETAARWPFPHA